MKATKFRKRNRSIEGRADGTVVCQLSFPIVGSQYELRPLAGDRKSAIVSARKFVVHHLKENAAVLEGSNFTIAAVVRAQSGGLRRKTLAVWRFNDDIDQVFRTAARAWERLEFEEDWEPYVTDIQNV